MVLIGQRAAGLAGAAAALLGMYAPSGGMVYTFARLWRRWEAKAWRGMAEQALAPVAIGLTLGSGIAVARGTEAGWPGYVLRAAATLTLAMTKLHPLLVMGAGAALGVAFHL